mmetsp:Transcript_40917/g.65780  ORF Transcript_40917/g.65780 Transcript_40917/m.65780 type:complete len:309 (+) Transcript_40917:423-1349(+)
MMRCSKVIHNVSRIEPSVVRQLSWNRFKGFCKSSDHKLLLGVNRSRIIAQVLAQLHLNGSTSTNNACVLHSPLHHHQGIMQGSFSFSNKLLCSTSKNDCGCLRFWAASEHIETFTSNLPLFEPSTPSENFFVQIVQRSLDDTPCRLGNSVKILVGNSARTEYPSVGEKLGGQVPNWKFRKNNFRTGVYNCLQLAIYYFPFSINNRLILGWVLNSNFRITGLGFELQLHIQEADFRVLEKFRCLFKSSVREGLFKRDPFYNERIRGRSSRNFFDSNHVQIQRNVTIQMLNRVNRHLAEEIFLLCDQLRV